MSTQTDQVRILIGDTAKTLFPDDSSIQLFIDLSAPVTGTELLLMSSALACESLAAKFSQGSTSLGLGDYKESFKQNDVSFQKQADRFRNLVYTTPAFAVAEDNVSNFSALEIIRNFILRTEP